MIEKESTAWRRIAELLAERGSYTGRGPGFLCDEVNYLGGRFGGEMEIGAVLKKAMLGRLRAHLPEHSYSAYQDDLDEMRDDGSWGFHYPHQDEAIECRILACFWLALECEAGGR